MATPETWYCGTLSIREKIFDGEQRASERIPTVLSAELPHSNMQPGTVLTFGDLCATLQSTSQHRVFLSPGDALVGGQSTSQGSVFSSPDEGSVFSSPDDALADGQATPPPGRLNLLDDIEFYGNEEILTREHVCMACEYEALGCRIVVDHICDAGVATIGSGTTSAISASQDCRTVTRRPNLKRNNSDKLNPRTASKVRTKSCIHMVNNGSTHIKGAWSANEDAMLRNLVSERGAKGWPAIAAEVPGRIGKQASAAVAIPFAPSLPFARA